MASSHHGLISQAQLIMGSTRSSHGLKSLISSWSRLTGSTHYGLNLLISLAQLAHLMGSTRSSHGLNSLISRAPLAQLIVSFVRLSRLTFLSLSDVQLPLERRTSDAMTVKPKHSKKTSDRRSRNDSGESNCAKMICQSRPTGVVRTRHEFTSKIVWDSSRASLQPSIQKLVRIIILSRLPNGTFIECSTLNFIYIINFVFTFSQNCYPIRGGNIISNLKFGNHEELRIEECI